MSLQISFAFGIVGYLESYHKSSTWNILEPCLLKALRIELFGPWEKSTECGKLLCGIHKVTGNRLAGDANAKEPREFLFGIFRNTLFQSSCGSFLNVIHFCYIQLEEGDPKKTPRALAKLGRAGTCFGKPWGLYPSPSLKFMGFVLMKTLHSGTFKPCGILAWELFLWCLFGNLENLAFFSNLGINFSAAPRQLVSSHYDRRPQAIALLDVLAKPTRVHPTLKNMNHAGSETTRDACSLIDGKKPSSVHHENHA